MSIKFTANEIRYIALFENMTGAMVKDCIIDDEHGKVTFVVKNGDMGLAIGKGGSTVSKVIAGLITYIGRDAIAEILPKELAYLAPIIVLIAGYVVVQATENTRVDVAEQIAVQKYQKNNPATEEVVGDEFDQP